MEVQEELSQTFFPTLPEAEGGGASASSRSQVSSQLARPASSSCCYDLNALLLCFYSIYVSSGISLCVVKWSSSILELSSVSGYSVQSYLDYAATAHGGFQSPSVYGT